MKLMSATMAMRMVVLLVVLVYKTYMVDARPEPPEERPAPGAFESDIYLSPEQAAAINESIEAIRMGVTERKAHAVLATRWPNAVLPYVISADSQGDSAVIKEAMEYWEGLTCLTFPPYDATRGHTSRINYMKDTNKCYSWVGIHNAGGSQDISIGEGCAERGTISHEIGHAMGFWHEQSRTDRDTYVVIHLENVKDGEEHNFNRYDAGTVNSYNVPYDVTSLMHYGPTYFSRNGLNTIDAVNAADQALMGQRDNLSADDVLLANVIYDCKRLSNVALGKTVWGSTPLYSDHPLSYAVDGNKNTDFQSGGCIHSNPVEYEPWFQVDIGSNQEVHDVIVTNRKDCCDTRIADAEVRVGPIYTLDFSQNTQCGHRVTATESTQTTLVFHCRPAITGRYVSIELQGRTGVLNFCEMEVMAGSTPRLVNVAIGQSASLSVERYADYPASKAVDGNTDPLWNGGSCTHTDGGYQSWFKVDLDGDYKVHEVVVTNRGDCCADRMEHAEVRVGGSSNTFSLNTQCGNRVTLAQSSETTLTFVCNPPVTGRYVSLQRMGVNGVLNFCEMEVMAGA